jgi:FlaA1/EpsC-like NDP-sugar epimerase
MIKPSAMKRYGDVRDLANVKYAMYEFDFIFYAAALKQDPSCEHFFR